MLLSQSGVKVKVIRHLAIVGHTYKMLLATLHYLPYRAGHYRPKRSCFIAIREPRMTIGHGLQPAKAEGTGTLRPIRGIREFASIGPHRFQERGKAH